MYSKIQHTTFTTITKSKGCNVNRGSKWKYLVKKGVHICVTKHNIKNFQNLQKLKAIVSKGLDFGSKMQKESITMTQNFKSTNPARQTKIGNLMYTLLITMTFFCSSYKLQQLHLYPN